MAAHSVERGREGRGGHELHLARVLEFAVPPLLAELLPVPEELVEEHRRGQRERSRDRGDEQAYADRAPSELEDGVIAIEQCRAEALPYVENGAGAGGF